MKTDFPTKEAVQQAIQTLGAFDEVEYIADHCDAFTVVLWTDGVPCDVRCDDSGIAQAVATALRLVAALKPE